MGNLLTKRMFAAAVGVSTRTIERWVSSGKIVPGYTPGGRMRFTDEHVDAILNGDTTWRKRGRKRRGAAADDAAATARPEPVLDPEQERRRAAYIWVRTKLLRRSLLHRRFAHDQE